MSSLLEPAVQKDFIKSLLSWYKKHGRHDMPWRKTKDPYAIFVSEFMLQQTTVQTVKPYYARFLKRFPTINSLAAADLNDVLALWSGLGYYARARNLWSSVREIKEEFKGKIPADPETLQKLPGIGAYTSGAITTLAYDRPAAVLDGNIIRVLMRVAGLEDDPKMKAVQVILRKLGLDLSHLSPSPRHLTLALMDLGATLCAPRTPECGMCPVSTHCLAKAYGRQEFIPPREEPMERPTVRKFHALINWKGKWLLGQNPPDGLFGGLWEFPSVEAPPSVEPVAFLEEGIGEELGFAIRTTQALPVFEHQLSHRIYLVRAFLCALKTSRAPKLKTKTVHYRKLRFYEPRQLPQLGISAITKRIAAEISTQNFS